MSGLDHSHIRDENNHHSEHYQPHKRLFRVSENIPVNDRKVGRVGGGPKAQHPMRWKHVMFDPEYIQEAWGF